MYNRRTILGAGNIAVWLGVLGFLGCGAEEGGPSGTTAPVKQVASSPTAPDPAGEKDSGEIPTPEEARQFAERMIDVLKRGDSEGMNALIDWDALLERTTAGIDVAPEVRDGFIKGVKEARNAPGSLVTELIGAVRRGGEISLLRVHLVDKSPRALLRMAFPENGGVNYYDMVLTRRPDGEVRAVDLFVYISGELFSQTLRKGYIQLAAYENRNFLDKLTGREQTFVQNLPKMKRMTDAIAAGQYDQALATFDELPEDLKHEKLFLLIRIRAAQAKDDMTLYAATIEDLRKHYPDDPSINFLSIDGYVLKKEFDKALASIDRLDANLGGDPYLNVLRAGILLQQGKNEEARNVALKAIAEEPSLLDAYWTLVTISLKEEKYDETLRLLTQLEKDFQLQMRDMSQIPEYAGFVKSPQYQEWQKAHPGGPQRVKP